MKQSVNTKYKVLQGLFWMSFCAGNGFVSLYLQGVGVDTIGIGIATAIFSLSAALLQPIFGRICDTNPNSNWRKMMLTFSCPYTLICVAMLLIPGRYTAACFVGLLILLTNLSMPFLNSAQFYYGKIGKYINFGIARGIGSASYAILALVIGMLADRYGYRMVPICGIPIGLLFSVMTYRMPYDSIPENKSKDKKTREKGFFRKYPSFGVMILASILMLTSHNIVNTYLLQIIQSLGGNSSQYGISIAIQAIVEVPILFCFFLFLKHCKPTGLMIISSAGFLLKAIMYVLSQNVFLIYLTQLTQMCSFAIYASASVYYSAEVIKEKDQTTGQAYMTSAIAVGGVIGSLIGGWMLSRFGVRTQLLMNVLVAGLGVALACLSGVMNRKVERKIVV